MSVPKTWLQQVIAGQLGITAEQLLSENIAALILDESLKVVSATRMASRLFDLPNKDLIGANLIEVLLSKPAWSWVNWVSPQQQVDLIESVLSDAVAFTATSREINVLTRGQMLYRGSINVVWREADATFALWVNTVDPLTNSDESVAMTTWVDGEKLNGSLGNSLTQRDLNLLLDYCRTKSVRELAELHNTTPKTMEHRLRRLAESYGCRSITELAKHQMHRRLVNVARPVNTLRAYCDFTLMDAVRYKKLRRHVLPKMSAVDDDTKRVDATDVTRRLLKNIFKR